MRYVRRGTNTKEGIREYSQQAGEEPIVRPMHIKITGFGYTWIEGDHSVPMIITVALLIVCINVVALRKWGSYRGLKPTHDA